MADNVTIKIYGGNNQVIPDVKEVEQHIYTEDGKVEKACNWLREQKEMIGISFQEDFIERFKMAMKK